MWFTDEGTIAAIGHVGTGTHRAAVNTPASPLSQSDISTACSGTLWSRWAGVTPPCTLTI
jgi:hypothetical protein